ncbi:putative small auxin-up RNA [Medicago truncatula]|uniref:Auxin responsive SAUR protein n=1 Tax=Medicago truncatula TaxID=3880 RepID=Q1SN26_MEDTR|nr:auxin-induced protein X15 [Medicago truncatula]ABE80127.1 Auxin responsive SAUR protein [Medicago truncatula]AES60641.1 SAUR-like auxin-responsive family protein [Medicago truncatula]RHN79640.1 putative small auxin-up RNA [Medicago truncatula]
MACMWRKNACSGKKLPSDVPRGHLAVTVGETNRRFVIRADYLNHPVLQELLDQAYEGYGFNKSGPLSIPCDEFLFEDILLSLGGGTVARRSSSPVLTKKLDLSFLKDAVPLLEAFDSKRSNNYKN